MLCVVCRCGLKRSYFFLFSLLSLVLVAVIVVSVRNTTEENSNLASSSCAQNLAWTEPVYDASIPTPSSVAGFPWGSRQATIEEVDAVWSCSPQLPPSPTFAASNLHQICLLSVLTPLHSTPLLLLVLLLLLACFFSPSCRSSCPWRQPPPGGSRTGVWGIASRAGRCSTLSSAARRTLPG